MALKSLKPYYEYFPTSDIFISITNNLISKNILLELSLCSYFKRKSQKKN